MKSCNHEKGKERATVEPVFAAIAEACGLELGMLDRWTASDVNLLRSDLDSEGLAAGELAALVLEFGHWHFDVDWKGHKATVKRMRDRWRVFKDWKKKNPNGKETEDERIARLIEETERRYPSKAH